MLLSLSGCGDVNSSTNTRVAQLRVIDASPDAGGLDIYLNASAAAYNLGFGSVSSYFPVVPGTYNATADQANTRTVLTGTRGTFLQNVQYTLLVGDVAGGLQSMLLTDQNAPAPSGQVLVRFIDEATRAGSLDIYLVPSGATLANSVPVAQGVTFSQIRNYISVPAGSFSIVVVPNGTTPSATTVATYAGGQTSFPGGSARTVVLLDTQLTAVPGVQVVIANDYDSPSATS